MPSRGQFSMSNYLERLTAIQSSGNITLACWYYPTVVGPVSPVGIYDTGSDKRWLRIAHMATGIVNAQWRDGGKTTSASSSVAADLDAWNFMALVFTPGLKLDIYLNNVLTSLSLTSSWPSPLDSTCIGIQHILSGYAQPCPGYIGQVGRWNTALAENQLRTLSQGAPFAAVSPDRLQNLYTCNVTGDEDDQVGSFNFVETGTVPVDDRQPPIVLPQPCLMTKTVENNLIRYSFTWQTDYNGKCEFTMPEDIDGTLHRFEARHEDAFVSGTYDVTLQDECGSDVLIGAGQDLNCNDVAGKVITIGVAGQATGVHQTVPVMGRHTLHIDSGETTRGTFDLYVLPELTHEAGII